MRGRGAAMSAIALTLVSLLSQGRRGVEPDRAGARLLGKTLHPSDVAAPDTCGQTIGGAIGYPHRVSLVTKLDDADGRAQDFFLRDPHLVLDAGKHRRSDKISAVADALAAGREQRTLPLADRDIIENDL